MTVPNFIHSAGASLSLAVNAAAVTGAETISFASNLHSVQPPNPQAGESSNTTLASPGAVGQSSPGWIKPGDWKFSAYLIDSQYVTLQSLKAARTPGEYLLWTITGAPGGAETVGFTDVNYSWIKGLEITEAKVDDDTKMMVNATLVMTGADTFTAGH